MRTLALVMAGGQGTRLYPLTRDRAKPAVPFGGKYRIVDFVLSNLVNSGIYSIYVLVQWRSQSLIEHLKDGWQFAGLLDDHFITPVPAQMRRRELVSGYRRRHLPEPQFDRRQQARSRRGVRRRPHLSNGHLADDRVPPRPQSRGNGGDAAGAGRGGRPVRGGRGRFRACASIASMRSRTIRARCRVRLECAWPRWAITCSIPRCSRAR